MAIGRRRVGLQSSSMATRRAGHGTGAGTSGSGPGAARREAAADPGPPDRSSSTGTGWSTWGLRTTRWRNRTSGGGSPVTGGSAGPLSVGSCPCASRGQADWPMVCGVLGGRRLADAAGMFGFSARPGRRTTPAAAGRARADLRSPLACKAAPGEIDFPRDCRLAPALRCERAGAGQARRGRGGGGAARAVQPPGGVALDRRPAADARFSPGLSTSGISRERRAAGSLSKSESRVYSQFFASRRFKNRPGYFLSGPLVLGFILLRPVAPPAAGFDWGGRGDRREPER